MRNYLTIEIATEEYHPDKFECHLRVKGGPRSAFYKAIEILKLYCHADLNWIVKHKFWRLFIATDTSEGITDTSVHTFENCIAAIKTEINSDVRIEQWRASFPRDEEAYQADDYNEEACRLPRCAVIGTKESA